MTAAHGEALRLLTQAYFHLDWPAEHEDPWQVVDEFCTSEPLAAWLPDEITDLLHAEPSEDGLRRVVLDELGCGYLPEAGGYTMTEWLAAVRDRTRDVARATSRWKEPSDGADA